jgi:hypothetical protein
MRISFVGYRIELNVGGVEFIFIIYYNELDDAAQKASDEEGPSSKNRLVVVWRE